MSANFTITKTTVECYKVRGNDTWADITVDAKENTGRIGIASDFGDWQYYWGACGKSFKEFLIGLDVNYAAGKFGEDRWFDLEKTICSLENTLKECVENKDEMLIVKEELKYLGESSCKDEFVHKMWDSPKIMALSEGCPNISTSINPIFQRFWDELWKEFVEELKKELE